MLYQSLVIVKILESTATAIVVINALSISSNSQDLREYSYCWITSWLFEQFQEAMICISKFNMGMNLFFGGGGGRGTCISLYRMLTQSYEWRETGKILSDTVKKKLYMYICTYKYVLVCLSFEKKNLIVVLIWTAHRRVGLARPTTCSNVWQWSRHYLPLSRNVPPSSTRRSSSAAKPP